MVELSIIHTNSPVLKTVLHLSNVFLESKIKKILQLCLKFSIIVFLQYVHVIHRRCNSVACLIWKRDVFKLRESFECYDTEFIELMPHTWNPIFCLNIQTIILFSMNRRLLCIYLPCVYDITNFICYIFLLKRNITLSLTAFCSFIVTSWTSVTFWRVLSNFGL